MERRELYERFRPTKLAELVGRADLARYVNERRRQGWARDSLLFVGPSGTGKTTAARIIARLLTGSEMDILELDAVKLSGVEEMRELADGFRYAAWGDGWKVYIVEEAHNLSEKAKEAWLKLCEDMPERRLVIFTSDRPDVFRETLWSRVKTFYMTRPDPRQMKAWLARIIRAAGLKMDAGTAALILARAGGNCRKALQELEVAATIGAAGYRGQVAAEAAYRRELAPPRPDDSELGLHATGCPSCGRPLPAGRKFCTVGCYFKYLGIRKAAVAMTA